MTPDMFWHEFTQRADAIVDALRTDDGDRNRAVSDQLIVNLLGGCPPEMEKAVLLPAERVGTLEPLDTLRNQWLEMGAELD